MIYEPLRSRSLYNDSTEIKVIERAVREFLTHLEIEVVESSELSQFVSPHLTELLATKPATNHSCAELL